MRQFALRYGFEVPRTPGKLLHVVRVRDLCKQTVHEVQTHGSQSVLVISKASELMEDGRYLEYQNDQVFLLMDARISPTLAVHLFHLVLFEVLCQVPVALI